MNTIEFDKKLICGPEFVAVRIIDNNEDLTVGSIVLPASAKTNERLALARVESVGSIAEKEYGLKVNDYVMIDRLSTFAHTAPVAALRYNNVICKTNENKTLFYPLRNMIFVQPDETGATTQVGSIVLNNYADKLHTGTIIAMNCDESLDLPYKDNDKVLLSTGADQVQIGNTTLYIYKHDMIVAKILEEK